MNTTAGLVEPVSGDDFETRAFIDGWNARNASEDFDMALHQWKLIEATRTPEASDTLEMVVEALKGLLATHKQGKGQCCEAADRAIDALAKAGAA